jgi:hypothetical protein
MVKIFEVVIAVNKNNYKINSVKQFDSLDATTLCITTLGIFRHLASILSVIMLSVIMLCVCIESRYAVSLLFCMSLY